MGQKVHPRGFRLGINKQWESYYYVDKEDYADTLQEDLLIRKLIEKKLKNARVDSITIKRAMNRLLIEVNVARPGVAIGRGGAGMEELKEEIQKISKQKPEIKLYEVKRPEISSKIVAENVAEQVSRRVIPKFAAQKEIENAQQSGMIKGIKIWVSGRIKGAEIARTEKFQWGTVPLHTLRADVDYTFLDCLVPNAGIHGIKVWIYKGEKATLD